MRFEFFRMFDSFLYDMVDGPVDRLFWIKNQNPVLAGPYPVFMFDRFIGNLNMPFLHFAGIGTIADWKGKFPFKLTLAPAAREWFVLRRSAWGHQVINYDNQFPISDIKHQLYIVGYQPTCLIPVETTVMIEHMHRLREGALNSVIRFNRLVTFSVVQDIQINLRKFSDIKGICFIF